MGRRKDKPRLIPEQDKRICRAICLCQLTMVLSCVSIVYLSVAIYSPSFKAFKSGFELEPVMCQTVQSDMPDLHCAWASCGEWCLTRTSGFCPQIYSVVRRNGTDIQLNNCSRITTTSCAMIDLKRLNKFNCNNGTACNHFHGVFNCSNGHCKNMSEFFLCHHKADGPTINSARDNTKLNGFFECRGVHCTKIKKPFSCDRYCSKITTSHINVLLMHEDNVIAADCENAVAFNEARGNEFGVRISPTEFWKEDDGNLLTNCATVERVGDKIIATDCINGTLLPHKAFPEPFMNFTQFWKIYEESKMEVDPEQKFLPNQHNLTIYKHKKLYINLEGCVNTLRGECKDFHARHGSDGDNNTAQSRYQCYYNKIGAVKYFSLTVWWYYLKIKTKIKRSEILETYIIAPSTHYYMVEMSDLTLLQSGAFFGPPYANDPAVEFVTARYDLKKVYNELLFSLIVPIVLFIVSSISLIIITTYVKVGDDAKMRCICGGEESDADEVYSARRSKKNKQNKILETMDNLNQLTILEDHDVGPADANAMIGSTKSLLPLSPTNDSGTTDNTCDDEKASKCDMPEKPLVVI